MSIKTIWHLQRGMAYLVVPILRITGLRFSKAWRSQHVIDHVAANVLADGLAPFPLRDFKF